MDVLLFTRRDTRSDLSIITCFWHQEDITHFCLPYSNKIQHLWIDKCVSVGVVESEPCTRYPGGISPIYVPGNRYRLWSLMRIPQWPSNLLQSLFAVIQETPENTFLDNSLWWESLCGNPGFQRRNFVGGNTGWNHPPWPGKIVATCMSYLTAGGPGNKCGTNKISPARRIQERSKGERRCQSICPTNLSESSLLEIILTEQCMHHQEWPWISMSGQIQPRN